MLWITVQCLPEPLALSLETSRAPSGLLPCALTLWVRRPKAKELFYVSLLPHLMLGLVDEAADSRCCLCCVLCSVPSL